MTASPEGAIPFGTRWLGTGHPVLVIAEIGVNHEGSEETCANLIEAAAAAAADAIKLQTIDADENYVRGTESHTLFSRCSLSREATAAAFRMAREHGMEAFTTAGDFATIEWVDRLAPAAHKISSGLLTTRPLIKHAARTGRTLLMSTGMAELAEVDAAVGTAHAAGAAGVGLFQCTSIYPAPPETLNLSAIRWLGDRYAVPVGFSDHSIGTECAPLAVAAGARMIEKHFTFDASRDGFDHHLSLEPSQFAELVRRVRRAETVMGVADKEMTDVEKANAARYHRVVVARHDIAAGEAFSTENLAMKRPPPNTVGLAPSHYEQLLGRTAGRHLRVDDPVVMDAVVGEL